MPKNSQKNKGSLPKGPSDFELMEMLCKHRPQNFFSEISVSEKDRPSVSSEQFRSPVALSIPLSPVFVVSDSPAVRNSLVQRLEQNYYQVSSCVFGSLLNDSKSPTIDASLVILDLENCPRPAEACFELFNAVYPGVPVILRGKSLPSLQDRQSWPRFLCGFIKEIEDPLLLPLTRSGLLIYQSIQENLALNRSIGLSIVPFIMQGKKSPALQKLWDAVSSAAAGDSHVLLIGEPGTRHDLVASQIHLSSGRKEARFDLVAVDLEIAPSHEPEIFGCEANSRSFFPVGCLGKLELMHRGTLLLYNIDYLGIGAQRRLLYYLKNNAFFRIGATSPRLCDTRIIATVSTDLDDLAVAGPFLSEICDRLSPTTIRLPSFREQKNDIPDFIRIAASWHAETLNKKTPVFEPGAIEKLVNHHWPYDVVEFEKVMQRIVMNNTTGTVTAKEIDFKIDKRLQNRSLRNLFGMTIDEIEKKLILETLDFFEGNKAQTARLLGISEKTLYNKLKKFDEIKEI